ncbi:hypothetical protein JYU23_00460 [bacterium AH-315-C07]|nr:hypothetical protein [bacterium AH-315-C07]
MNFKNFKQRATVKEMHLKLPHNIMVKTILFVTAMSLGWLQSSAENPVEANTINSGLVVSPLASSGNDSEGITSGGFFFHIGGFFPSKMYYYPKAIIRADAKEIFADDPGYGTGAAFELGNMFRIVDLEEMAIGLKATWFSAHFTQKKVNDTITFGMVQASVVRIGPYFTYSISDDMAVDIYFQTGPTFSTEVIYDSFSSSALGFAHNMGVTYRFSKLSVALEYYFGSISDTEMIGEDVDDDFKDFGKYRTNGVRFMIGMKL